MILLRARKSRGWHHGHCRSLAWIDDHESFFPDCECLAFRGDYLGDLHRKKINSARVSMWAARTALINLPAKPHRGLIAYASANADVRLADSRKAELDGRDLKDIFRHTPSASGSLARTTSGKSCSSAFVITT